MKFFFIVLLYLYSIHWAMAQHSDDSVLQEIIIPIQSVKNFHSISNSVVVYDSLTSLHNGTSTDFFKQFSFIHFRENGYGMVSSPSFRGTTAQQTSVLWNGVPINSIFLGQSDFNSLSIREYDEIEIISGGGSVALGSGAVGGSILLNNKINFNTQNHHKWSVGYTNTDTYRAMLKNLWGQKHWHYSSTLQYTKSQNNYEWKKIHWKNINGAFENFSFSPNIAFKINNQHSIAYFGNFYTDQRHFSLTTPYQTPTKYKNFNTRNLLKWKSQWLHNKKLEIDIAHLQEQYQYYPNIAENLYTDGTANTLYGKSFLQWRHTNLWYNAIQLEYKHSKGHSTQNPLKNATQTIADLSWHHSILLHKNWKTELGIKKEWNKNFENPFLYSAALQWQKKHWSVAYLHNKNYRTPTFNDLFWEPGGNKKLKPETSYQNELKIAIQYENFSSKINLYTNKISDMIRWIPTSQGYWKAENTDKVTIYGLEYQWHYTQNYPSWKWHTTIQYSYTKAINNLSKTQLIFVPKHKISTQYHAHCKLWHLDINTTLMGKIYTTADENKDFALKEYYNIDAKIGKYLHKNKKWHTQAGVNNLTNNLYYIAPARPTPNRNYFVQLTYQF